MYVFVCPYEYVYVCDMCPVQEKWEICTSTQFFHFLSHVCVCVLSFDGLYLSLGMYIPTYDVPNLKRVVILTGVCVWRTLWVCTHIGVSAVSFTGGDVLRR